MKFLVVTHVAHCAEAHQYYAYAPYTREMNLWARYVDSMEVVAPLHPGLPDAIELPYEQRNLRFIAVPAINITTPVQTMRALVSLPLIAWMVFAAMRRADHIHLRCPGNMGLIGCFVQIFFPNKPKSVKYAGNWDWKSPQPWSYKLQQRILRNSFLSRNMTVLVYGNWPDRTRNIRPFFTASYRIAEVLKTPPRALDRAQPVRLIFVGTLTENKRPMLAIETAKLLKTKDYKVQLDLYGEGDQRSALATKIAAYQLQDDVVLHGNVSAETLKKDYQSAHFLLFASKSEGWPKAVAEAMFWGCLPVTTSVSCVPDMLGHGSRGDLVAPEAGAMADVIDGYFHSHEDYTAKCRAAMEWSRQYTIDFFETEISRILTVGTDITPH